MSYIVVNALEVAAGAGAELERRFAGRAGLVETAPGFEHFELLRPVEGTSTYLVYTRWESKAAFEGWQSSQDFGRGHGEGRPAGAGGERPAPVATGSQIWAYELVSAAEPHSRNAERVEDAIAPQPEPGQRPG